MDEMKLLTYFDRLGKIIRSLKRLEMDILKMIIYIRLYGYNPYSPWVLDNSIHERYISEKTTYEDGEAIRPYTHNYDRTLMFLVKASLIERK